MKLKHATLFAIIGQIISLVQHIYFSIEYGVQSLSFIAGLITTLGLIAFLFTLYSKQK